jgi:hypothetical protein
VADNSKAPLSLELVEGGKRLYTFRPDDANPSGVPQAVLTRLLPIAQAWHAKRYHQWAKLVESLLGDEFVYPLDELTKNDISAARWVELTQALLAKTTEGVITSVQELSRKEEFVKQIAQKLAVTTREISRADPSQLVARSSRAQLWHQQLAEAYQLAPVEELELSTNGEFFLRIVLSPRNIKAWDDNIYQLPAMRLYAHLKLDETGICFARATKKSITCWQTDKDVIVKHPHINSETDNHACLGEIAEAMQKALANDDLFSFVQLIVNWSGNVKEDETHQDRLMTWCKKMPDKTKLGAVKAASTDVATFDQLDTQDLVAVLENN